MKLRIDKAFQNTIIFAFTILFGLMVIAGYSMFDHTKYLASQRRWVIHTQQALISLGDIDGALIDAEAGQRGYLATGRRSHLKTYESGRSKLVELMNGLEKLISDNPRQVANSVELKKVIGEELTELQEFIDMYRTGARTKAMTLGLAESEGEEVNAIRAVITRMSDEEQRLLDIRMKNLEEAAAGLEYRLGIVSAASLLIFLVAGLTFHSLGSARAIELLCQELVYSVTSSLLQESSATDTVADIPKNLCEILDYKVAVLWQPTEEGTELTCAKFYSTAEVPELKNTCLTSKFEIGDGLPGIVWKKKEPEFMKRLSQEQGFNRLKEAKKYGLNSALAFPIMMGEQFFGVLEFFNDHIVKPDKRLKKAFDVVGVEIGQLIERQRSQEKVLESERKFKAIFDHTYEFIGLLKTDGSIVDANRTALDFVGMERVDVIGKPFWETPWWSHDKNLQKIVRSAVKAAARGEFVRFECASPSLSGDLVYFDVSIKPITDDAGKVLLLLPEGRDITEKKQAEIRVSEFYSTVSHELRTPLTSIRGSLGLMEGGLSGGIPEKAMKLIKIARTESDRLIRLINDILDIRKIEAGMLELKKSELEPDKLIEQTIFGVGGMAQERGIELQSVIESTTNIVADQDRVAQVLTNLLSNAIKFSTSGQQVTVKLEQVSPKVLRFSIIDQGCGIPEKHMSKLFGMFQQIDQSDSRKNEGTGLGLAICKAIVEQHGGTIGVDSVEGEGSTFWFELPITGERVDSSETEVMGSQTIVHPAILVEDDDNIATLLELHLKEEGFEVVRAKTIAQARTLLQKYRALVIVLDLNLPDGNGLDLLEEIREDKKLSEIPVVIVTGQDEDNTRTYSHPALVDWIGKPFEEERLHSALNQAKLKIGPAQVLIVEDDPSTREILKQQIAQLGVKCLEAKDGIEAVIQYRAMDPDLIILDLSIPPPDGFGVVDILKKENLGMKPLIVYTSSDLSKEEKSRLTLGLTAHLTKGHTSQEKLVGTVVEFLNGLLLGRTAKIESDKEEGEAAGESRNSDAQA